MPYSQIQRWEQNECITYHDLENKSTDPLSSALARKLDVILSLKSAYPDVAMS